MGYCVFFLNTFKLIYFILYFYLVNKRPFLILKESLHVFSLPPPLYQNFFLLGSLQLFLWPINKGSDPQFEEKILSHFSYHLSKAFFSIFSHFLVSSNTRRVWVYRTSYVQKKLKTEEILVVLSWGRRAIELLAQPWVESQNILKKVT